MRQASVPLDDIILPDPVSFFWPPAIGWWLLLALLIVVIVLTAIAVQRYRKKWGYRKAGLTLLKQQYQQWQQSERAALDNNQACQGMLIALKRTALSAYPQQQIKALHGQAWVELLTRHIKGDIDQALVEAICEQQYRPDTNIDIDSLYRHCQHWIKHHHLHYCQPLTGGH